MKKSTLFFKVMVLLALLVPWTAWGQNAAWWNNTSNERGSYTISFEEGEAIDLTLDLANSEELNLNGYEFYISTSNGTLPTGINASVTEDQETKISFKGTYGTGLAETYTVKYYVSYSADTKQSGYFTFIFQKKKPVAWDEGEKGTVKIYVNSNNVITKSDPVFKDSEGNEYPQNGRLPINLDGFKGLLDWVYSKSAENEDQPLLNLTEEELKDFNVTWGIPMSNEGILSVVAKDGLFATLPKDVKAKIENGDEVGYVLLSFIKDDTPEETTNWSDPVNKQAEIKVYINEEGTIVKADKGEVKNGILLLTPNDVNEDLSDWAISRINQIPVTAGDEIAINAYDWATVIDTNKDAVVKLRVEKKGETSIYDQLEKSVKVEIENGEGETGHILVTFVKDESTEEPENPNEPDWAQEKANGTVTAYVNPEGSITRVEGDGKLESGRLVVAPNDGWKFSVESVEINGEEMETDQPVFADKFLSKSFTWSVTGNGNLNVYGLDNNESVYNILPKEVKLQIKNGEQTSYVLIKFVQDDDTWAKEEFAKATVTVYVDAEGNVISTTPTLTVDGKNAINNNGALTISLEEVELAEWAYSAELLDGNLTSNPETSGDDISTSFSLMINGEGNLFVENVEPYVSQLPATVKVKIENGDNVGYLEIAFEKIIVIDPSDIAGGDDDDENGEIDENGNLLGTAEGEKTVYDSETHELAILKVNGLDEPLRVGEDYTVVYTAQESGDLVDDLPYHAGTYNVTITLGDKYITTTGAKEFATTVEITKRDLHLAFSIEENTTIEDLNEKLDLAGGLVICTPNNLAPNDDLSGVITATFTIGQTPVDGLYPVYPETIHFENTADFDREDYNITYDYTDLAGIEHQEDITPDEDGDVEFGDGEGEIPADDPIGGIEYVDPETGEGSAGGYYEKKYRLYLAVKDKNNYYVEDAEADYKAEGLELFSRRDKKTTWAGGSFTVYYKHNDVVNEGGYRVFIKRGKHADYEEVKLDEVSGYYQIRNVQSDIYVRLYYGTGFPVANEEITATDARAYAQANKIVVITPEPTDVQIISMAGAVVATDQVTGQREFANLAEGVYIVRMGETVIKLQVRN